MTGYQKVISQNYIWIAVQSNGWAPRTHYARYKISIDSIAIGHHFYHQVLNSSDPNGNAFYKTEKYVRESAGQLWVLDSLNAIAGEVLIMDMNLNKGDIFEYTDIFGQPNKFFISNTDTIVDLSGKSRKVVYLSCEGSLSFVFRWIEGIGPDAGVFQPWLEQCTIDGNPNILTCFYSDGIQQWQHPDFNLCWANHMTADTTDMDRSAIWYSSSYTGNFGDGDCKLKIDITKVVRDIAIDDRLCRILGVYSAGEYLPESEVITFQKQGKLYFYEDSVWKLLYDYTAKAGDTVTYYIAKNYHYYGKYAVPQPYENGIPNENPFKMVIEKMDTITYASGKI